MAAVVPRILLIDSYDSFTHNLAHLVRRNVPSSQIYLIRNDDLTYESLLFLLPSFSAVVVGPGPGSPANDADVGIIRKLWCLPEPYLLPVFGVCLGFQSLVLAFGGTLRTMQVVKHGMICQVEHGRQDLFEGAADDVMATRYHSLCVDLISEESKVAIEPLAWSYDGEENGKVLMAARHTTKPFWGVQYHPESICTHGGGSEVIRNFWTKAVEWSSVHERKVLTVPESAARLLGESWPHARVPRASSFAPKAFSVSSLCIELPHLTITKACELLGVSSPDTNFVMLDSAANPGRFTIIGALLPATLSIRYTHPEPYVTLQRGAANPRRESLPAGIWDWLSEFMRSRTVQHLGREDVPFWGGLVGYLSYELGVAGLGVPLKHRMEGSKRHTDVNLVFVERSIVIDGETGRVHIQSLIPNDGPWLRDMSHRLERKSSSPTPPPMHRTTTSGLHSRLTSPSQESYVSQVLECKHHLAVGSSYELCLTAPSTLHIRTSRSPWDLYTRLRASNPAPYAAFLRLGCTTLLCSSPERFLKWDRAGCCELRPIKGTLRKTIVDADGNKRHVCRKDASEMLSRNVKERAENLMIVDLVRHDLGGVVQAADGVVVEQLMGIEEYETVWQMVSVISGRVSAMGGGWEVLRKSLPPGSMTGAPKKRSVELLQDIEGRERGIYSGVCGYWCVGGGGDWAVIIRSCFRYDDGDDIHLEDDNIHLHHTCDNHFNSNSASHFNSNGTPDLDDTGTPHLNGNGTPHLNGNGISHLNGHRASHVHRTSDNHFNGNGSHFNGNVTPDLDDTGIPHLNGNGTPHLNGNRASHLNGNRASHLNGNRAFHLNGNSASHLNGARKHNFNSDNHFHLNGETREQRWSLGAGGAITALSDPVAEWEEMRVKLGSVGRAFGVDEL